MERAPQASMTCKPACPASQPALPPPAQVDEFGTEAAAVTAVIVGKAALPADT